MDYKINKFLFNKNIKFSIIILIENFFNKFLSLEKKMLNKLLILTKFFISYFVTIKLNYEIFIETFIYQN